MSSSSSVLIVFGSIRPEHLVRVEICSPERTGAVPRLNKEPIHTFADLLCLSIHLLGWTLSPAGTTDVLEKQGGQKSSLSRIE